MSMAVANMIKPLKRGTRVSPIGLDIGSRFVRRDYTCIGDVVNRAQRHESKAPLGGVLLSADLYARIREHVEVEEMTGITLKGIDHPVSAFVLKGFRG